MFTKKSMEELERHAVGLICLSGGPDGPVGADVPATSGDPLTAESDGRVIALGDPARTDDVLEALADGHDYHHHHD